MSSAAHISIPPARQVTLCVLHLKI